MLRPKSTSGVSSRVKWLSRFEFEGAVAGSIGLLLLDGPCPYERATIKAMSKMAVLEAWSKKQEKHKHILIGFTPTRTHPSALHTRARPYLLSRNTRAPHFTPQHWLLCHMGLY